MPTGRRANQFNFTGRKGKDMGALAVVENVSVVGEINPRGEFAQRITDGYNRIYRDVLAIGAMLVEAQEQLAHGEFLAMLGRDLPFSQRTAYNYMREWTIANTEDLQPVATIGQTPTVRAEIDRLTDEELAKGLATGKLFKGISRSQVQEFKRELRVSHQHRPESSKCPAPSRPTAAGARSYSELVYLLIEWRKSKGISQAAMDDLIGWGEGQTSKYEIPHQDDGRIASWAALLQWMQGLGLGIQLVPVS
jgi:hypothetical protein